MFAAVQEDPAMNLPRVHELLAYLDVCGPLYGLNFGVLPSEPCRRCPQSKPVPASSPTNHSEHPAVDDDGRVVSLQRCTALADARR